MFCAQRARRLATAITDLVDHDGAHFDYVIVGAGSAGCVLAARLSEDRRRRVALLEAGGRDNHLYITMPAAVREIRRSRHFDWNYVSEPIPGCDGRRVAWPRGKVLGGSSSINGMMYVRGNRDDYDRWSKMGLTGWSFAECLPYFKRAESNRTRTDSYHSQSGPLAVTDASSGLPLYEALIEAGRQAGYPECRDFNGAEQEGVGYFQFNIGDGERCSTARAYLHPAAHRPNLTVLINAHATRVVFEAKRATGVEYSQLGARRRLHADKEVILSAGTINSPQLLKLSGIGPADELARHGIEVVAHLRGVGENLQDHFDYHVQYECLTADSFDKYTANPFLKAWVGLQYLLSRKGPGISMPVEAGGFLKTRAELAAPDVELQVLAALVSNDAPKSKDDPRNGFLVHVTNLCPESRGRITLRSPDPFAPPAISPHFLETPGDRAVMREGVQIARRIVAQPALDPYRGREVQPGSGVVDDEALDRDIAAHGDIDHHAVGTCAMGVDEGAVVDALCRVREVERLRVVDASVMPLIVRGNTNAPTIMIAEKVADTILDRPPLPVQ